jgi:hypothetical protein
MREPVPRETAGARATREYHRTRVTALTKTLPGMLARIQDPEFPEDKLNPLEILARDFRSGLLQSLGGAAACTTAQLAIVSTLTTSWVLLGSIDTYLYQLAAKEDRGILDRKRRRVAHVVQQRMAMATTFLRQLQMLGLDKRPQQTLPTIDELFSQQAHANAPAPVIETTNGHQAHAGDA